MSEHAQARGQRQPEQPPGRPKSNGPKGVSERRDGHDRRHSDEDRRNADRVASDPMPRRDPESRDRRDG